jgi:hypothetical protein
MCSFQRASQGLLSKIFGSKNSQQKVGLSLAYILWIKWSNAKNMTVGYLLIFVVPGIELHLLGKSSTTELPS